MKTLANFRKADRRLGDDPTFTRWVAEPGRHKAKQAPTLVHPDAAGTLFPGRVLPTSAMQNLLVSGHNNIKLGRDCRIGKRKGYWIYALSFEERATCPTSCAHWRDCYGNNMPFGKRVDHTSADLLPRLEAELARLTAVRGRKGVIVRLHALGDFFSPEYVQFWDRMLEQHPTLVIFGFTAWGPTTPIGAAVSALIDHHPGRAMMRFSDGGLSARSTVSIEAADDCPPGAFVCPEQTGQFDACGKCGACWSTLKNVAFVAH